MCSLVERDHMKQLVDKVQQKLLQLDALQEEITALIIDIDGVLQEQQDNEPLVDHIARGNDYFCNDDRNKKCSTSGSANHCIECNADLGEQNPRQYCGKTYCVSPFWCQVCGGRLRKRKNNFTK